MKIVLFGATGMIGTRIATEALSRGHEVTAVSRSGRAPEGAAGGTGVSGDAADAKAVAELAAGHDVVVSAVSPPRDGSDPLEPFTALYAALLDGVRASGVQRLAVVGGAGSLLVGEDTKLVHTPGFPEIYKQEALTHDAVLTSLRTVDDLDWVYVSPAAEIAPGERTGTFRLGGDHLLSDADGRSRISAEDYAVAFVDELERRATSRARITVAY
ncbi:NAD(P)-dependent oxidoreductase [Streptomyces sp. WAC06614]|uniref:NAD(P)-dependent oxidoreductase n=1 Tax=Streptomyces sp. WAC06614 TaxID=2487416 RepID=UPI000F770A4B|nr:NAD(P)-dependent oxidoreductase [Streptomyces sp. WAC06614]RSS72833.1 NAD(P)-dependent oxidoreductase [Streptomyces sp. WAC06614]